MPGHHTFHGGSTLFLSLADYAGLRFDQLNFVFCQWVSLVIAVLYFKYCPKTMETRRDRLLGLTAIGILMCLFCYGNSVKHLITYSICCYLILCWVPTKYVHKVTFIFAMSYLSFIHFYRIYHTREYSVDVTGPMMIMTQKVTSLAFSLHDGAVKSEGELTNIQKKELVREIPSALEFSCYLFNFMGVLCGPLCFFSDFIAFIDVKNFRCESDKKWNSNKIGENENTIQLPWKMLRLKLACTLFYMSANLPCFRIHPIETIVDLDVSFITQLLCTAWDVFLVRMQYYYAWTMSDCINNAAGFGFSGFDEKTGDSKWDLISNIDVWKVETANNFRSCLEGWNHGTMHWLRRVAYERTPKSYRTIATYVTSAWWHGFFPGYYVTFLTAALFTLSSRIARRHIRPYFLSNSRLKFAYDCLTFVVTRLSMIYLALGFILLEWTATYRFYSHIYFCMHIGAMLLLVVVPHVVPKKEATSPKIVVEEEERTGDTKVE